MGTKAPKKKQPKPLPSAVLDELERQQRAIHEAQALVQCVLTAIEEHFSDWPRGVPLFNYALRPVVNLLGSVATALYEEEFTAAVAIRAVSDESDEDE
jgi:hypothetical protein